MFIALYNIPRSPMSETFVIIQFLCHLHIDITYYTLEWPGSYLDIAFGFSTSSGIGTMAGV